jgi:hypothetical protein
MHSPLEATRGNTRSAILDERSREWIADSYDINVTSPEIDAIVVAFLDR